MPVPTTVPQTTDGYLEYLGDIIKLADKMWTHYAWAASEAYAAAYKHQMNTLSKVKKALERLKQEDYNRMAFALSILTVGVAGGVAGAVARFMYDNKDFQDATKDVIKAVVQKRGALIDALSPDKAVSGIFAPDDTTPEEYTTHLHEGISKSIAVLTQVITDLKWKPRTETTFDEVKDLAEIITGGSLITDMPQAEIPVDLLTRKALLALWIGWALARDDKYWRVPADNKQSTNGWDYDHGGESPPRPDGFWEQYYWEPVRHELLTLGVPTTSITATLVMQDVGWGKTGAYKEFPGLYVWGFMAWAASPLAVNCLFDRSMLKYTKGFEKAQEQMSRRMLTGHGWVDRAP